MLLRRGASRIGRYPDGTRGIATATVAAELEATAEAIEDGSLIPGQEATFQPPAV
jgi:hypothetical protein